MELGAVEWILEEEEHVKQILSESSEMCFPFCLYYPYLSAKICLNSHELQVIFEEAPPSCLRQQVQPRDRCQASQMPKARFPQARLL